MLSWSVNMYLILFKEDKDEQDKFPIPPNSHPDSWLMYNQQIEIIYI